MTIVIILFLKGYHSAAIAKMAILVVDDCKLPWCDALNILVALDEPLIALDMRQMPGGKVWSVAVFECYLMSSVKAFPWVAAYKVHLIKVDDSAILLAGAVAVAYINGIVLNVLLNHIPGPATQAQPLALANGVEPVAIVLTQLAASFYFNNWPLLHAQVAANEVVIVYLP